MIHREPGGPPSPSTPKPFHAELALEDGEMLTIADAAKECFDAAIERDAFVITDAVIYDDIPYLSTLATPGIILGLRGRKLTKFSVDVPKKGSSIAIKIVAQDALNPNRKYTFTELTDELEGDFFVDDSDSKNAALAHKPVDFMMTREEIAHWLYRQAGMTEQESSRRMKEESDPVQDAAHLVGPRASRLITQRQVRVDLSPTSQFFAEEIAVFNPDELHVIPHPSRSDIQVARPIRFYSTWINQGFETETYGNVKETILASFSPDNPALAIPTFYSNTSLQLETDKTMETHVLPSLFLKREEYYKGRIAGIFKSATVRIKKATELAKLKRP